MSRVAADRAVLHNVEAFLGNNVAAAGNGYKSSEFSNPYVYTRKSSFANNSIKLTILKSPPIMDTVFAPFAEEKIPIDELISEMSNKNKIFLAGKISG